MTWSSVIVKADGSRGICIECKHAPMCKLPNVSYPVANILTSVDTACDGHMASGTAELRCNGFEPEDGPQK